MTDHNTQMVKLEDLIRNFKSANKSYRKINGCDAVEDDEDVVVGEVLEAVVHSGREEEGEDLEVEVEGGPRGRLVLRDGGDDRDVVLGVGRVQEGVEPENWLIGN